MIITKSESLHAGKEMGGADSLFVSLLILQIHAKGINICYYFERVLLTS